MCIQDMSNEITWNFYLVNLTHLPLFSTISAISLACELLLIALPMKWFQLMCDGYIITFIPNSLCGGRISVCLVHCCILSPQNRAWHIICAASGCTNLLDILIKSMHFFLQVETTSNIYILRLTVSIYSSKEELW